MQNFEQTEFTFDVEKMQSALKEVESIAQQQYHYGGTNDGGAICLTQIPGDKDSISGGNVLGIYWEKYKDWKYPYNTRSVFTDPKYIKDRDETFSKTGNGWWWNWHLVEPNKRPIDLWGGKLFEPHRSSTKNKK